jgi:cytochrome c
LSRSLSAVGAVILTLSLAGCGGGTKSGSGNQLVVDTSGASGSSAPAAAEPAFASLTGNPANGESAFMQCATCHTTTGAPSIGPSLHGIVGRRAGSLPGFAYSPAMQASGKTWTPEELYHFIGAPQGSVPGTRMSFAGIRDPQRRADLVAWLATQ